MGKFDQKSSNAWDHIRVAGVARLVDFFQLNNAGLSKNIKVSDCNQDMLSSKIDQELSKNWEAAGVSVVK